jgi:hypothetical protein
MKQLLHQILEYCMIINETTPMAAYYDISGHVSKIQFRVGAGKETRYNDYLFYEDVYYSHPAAPDVDYISDVQAFIGKIESFMAEHGVLSNLPS